MTVVAFSPPDIREEDIQAVVDVLRSGWITSGPIGRQFETALTERTGASGIVALNSCTAALELALRVAGVGPGDEVIVPAYTYTASASAAHHVGADLKLVDVGAGAYVPTVEQIMAAVTSRTKAVIVVDLAGVPFNTPALVDALTQSEPVDTVLGRPWVIVDAAHSLGASLGGRPAGSMGDFTAFSFHAVKNLTTAEGGALAWRSGLPFGEGELERTIRRLSLHGQTKDALAKTQAGQWEYDILEPAYKCNMPDVLAALGLSQLQRYDSITARRRDIVDAYSQGLGDLLTFLEHPGDPAGTTSSAHLAITDVGAARQDRNEIIRGLAARGIASNVHYKPLPLLTAYSSMGFRVEDYPNSLQMYQAELTLPLHTRMSDGDVSLVIEAVRSVVGGLP